jgi:ribosomal protein S18 acetylase RimI-like enzyme
MIRATVRPLDRKDVDWCEAIVRALPGWFGIEAGIAEARGYLETQEGVVVEVDGRVAGFLTYASAFPESVEITWMAVAPEHHRRGIGRALMEAVVTEARARGATLLLVKTLAETHPSPEYARTRAFYQAVGFGRLTVLPEHWNPAYPCLLMVRPIG